MMKNFRNTAAMLKRLKDTENTWRRNLIFRVILAAQAAVLIMMGAYCLRGKSSYMFTFGDLNVESDLVKEAENEDGGYYYVSLAENIAETVLLETDVFQLPAGAYDVRIHYTTQVNFDEDPYYYNGNGYLYFESADEELNFDFTRIFLRNGTDTLHEHIRISSLTGSGKLCLCVSYYGLGEMSVYSIEVRELVAYRYLSLFGIILLFAVMDFIIFCLFLAPNFGYRKELGLLTLICLAAILPFLVDYNYYGFDIEFHLHRIVCLAEEITQGNYFPAVYSGSLNGYGIVEPLFYGQVFLYFPAILYACGVPLSIAFNLYICAVSIATCLIMYYCALRIFGKTSSALLSAALYTLSAYRLNSILNRSAVGEFTAQAFLPLVVLGFYNIYMAPGGEKIPLKKYWPLIIGLTGVFSSHILSAVMCVILIFGFCVVFIRRTLEPKRFFALLRAGVLTILVCFAQLIPLLDSMRMQVTVNYVKNYYQDRGTFFIQLFNSVVNNYQADDKDGMGMASNEMSMSIGFSLTVGLVLFLVYLAKRGEKGKSERASIDRFASVCWGMSVIMILLSTKMIPYDYLDFLPDRIYSFLTVYQFPYRWLIFATLFGVFCTAAVAGKEELSTLFGRITVSMLLCMILVMNTGQIYSDQADTSYKIDVDDPYFYEFAAAWEYYLYGTDTSQLYYNQLIYDSDQMSAGDYRYRDNRWLLSVDNTSESYAVVDIPVFHYDNYIAYDVETGEEIDVSTGENNRIRLTIPAGYAGTVAVKYRIRTLWKLAIMVSVLTDLILMCFSAFSRKQRRLSSDSDRMMSE